MGNGLKDRGNGGTRRKHNRVAPAGQAAVSDEKGSLCYHYPAIRARCGRGKGIEGLWALATYGSVASPAELADEWTCAWAAEVLAES